MLLFPALPWCFEAFLAALAFFHLSEFFLAWRFMRHEFSLRSLLISKPYAVAMVAAVAEFWAEQSLVPGIKCQRYVASCGMAMVLVGELTRKTAMLTAQGNFTHDIQRQHRPTHKLVRHGIYRLVRHPGYMGWYIWCIGTQVLLVNPVCACGFAYVAWHFFNDRIRHEEQYLRAFFGQAYREYARSTPSGVPLVR